VVFLNRTSKRRSRVGQQGRHGNGQIKDV